MKQVIRTKHALVLVLVIVLVFGFAGQIRAQGDHGNSVGQEETMISEEKIDFPYKWNLKRHHGNPVLRPVPGTWEFEWFGVATVIRIDDEFYMYYRGSDTGNKNTQIGLAFSKDGATWTRYKENPVWRMDNWEYFIRDARVYQFGGEELWMYYTDGDRHIDLAHSTDGIHWVRSPDNPIFVLDVEGTWDAGKVSTHVICRMGPNSFNIYYSGAPSPGATYAGVGLVQGQLTRVASSP